MMKLNYPLRCADGDRRRAKRLRDRIWTSGAKQRLELTFEHVTGGAHHGDGYRPLGESFFQCLEVPRIAADVEARESPGPSAFHEEDAVPAKAAHTIRTIDWPAEQYLGNRAGFTVAVDQNAEDSAGIQGIDDNAPVENGNTVENSASGTERPAAGPDLQPSGARREANDLHVVAVGGVSRTIRSDCNVIAKGVRRRHHIASFERPGVEIVGMQGGGRRPGAVVRPVCRGKARPQGFGSFVGIDAEHTQRGLRVGPDPPLRRGRPRLYSKVVSHADAADEDGAVGS